MGVGLLGEHSLRLAWMMAASGRGQKSDLRQLMGSL